MADKKEDDAPEKTSARSARSEATRQKIINVAVKLFAERGIDGVSLNDINRAAGQRNKNATHYHFGSKEGLIQAILDKFEPRLAARRDDLLDEYESRGDLTLRNVVRAMILPMAERLSDFEGGRDYIRFSAHMVVNLTMTAMHLTDQRFQLTSIDRLINAMMSVLKTDQPPAIQLQRGLLLGMLLTHSFSEHAKMLDEGGDIDQSLRTEIFIANLEDCLTAVMDAPVSEGTETLLNPKSQGME